MSYRDCIERAGAEVLDFKEFGSYQGTWLAFVKLDGQKGIVEGYYGSCSGCDSFLMTFGYSEEPIVKQKDGKYYDDNNYWSPDYEITEEEALKRNAALEQKYVDFGKQYLLNGVETKAFWERKLEKVNTEDPDDWFSQEEREQCEWVLKQDWDDTQ